MPGIKRERLEEFVAWTDKHITGDEKGEAQIFLDRLFQAFGHAGCKDAGGTLEHRIRKDKESGGGTSFADYVWKPVVLIEMKRRGEDLTRHFRQAFDYWTRLVPGRPRYVILCNFDEFWVYDFETQMDSPVDKLKLVDLPSRDGPLAFLFPKPERPVFGNDHVAVTREAADRLATCFNKLSRRADVDRETARRFILQMLVALFAEDIGLLEKYFVTRLLDDCHAPQDSYDLLGALFAQMNTREQAKGGRFQTVPYFNGGLFEKPARLELHDDELNQLKKAAESNWSMVQPEIFGTIFEHSMETDERRAFGAHFTSPVDIMKIVGPTIVEPWRQQIEEAKTIKRLSELHNRLSHLRVLDPACGSGNFLYIAYREMKRLEASILARIDEMSARGDPGQRELGFVTAAQFYGLDINPFAVELAKVTMMIARKLAIDELHISEPALPLDNLDSNFRAADALIDDQGRPVKWPAADVIIGNPPFVGAKLLKPWRGADYADTLRDAYPEVPGMADYCVYWFRKAQDHLPECSAEDPTKGRAGLVGTQNIRNNKSRVGGLDYIVQRGTIVEAVDNQPWSGEANVHVSIANWVKHAPPNQKFTQREQSVVREGMLIPERRRLWFKVEQQPAKTKIRKKRGEEPATKEYELAFRECSQIYAALSDKTDVTAAKVLKCNTQPQRCFQGVIPGYEGFVLSPDDAKRLVEGDPESAKVLHPFLIGRDVVTGTGKPTRMVIDLNGLDLTGAQQFRGAFTHLKSHVLPLIEAKAKPGVSHDAGRAGHLEKWWEMWRPRPAMLKALRNLSRYIVCSGVTKRPIFSFVDSSIRADHATFAFAFEDDYSFGLLQSGIHWLWFITKCSKLTERFRYTPPSVYDTFPWPQAPSVASINAVATAAQHLRQVRDSALTKTGKGGLRAVYRTLELPGKDPLKDAHAALDAAVLDAYGFSPKQDLLAQLLELNLAVAAKLAAGEPVTAPGIPPGYPEPAKLVTEDCVRPAPPEDNEVKRSAPAEKPAGHESPKKSSTKHGKGSFWESTD